MSRKPHVVFLDVGTINEPVSAALQLAADGLKFQAQHDVKKFGEHCLSHSHARMVQAQHRVEQAIRELDGVRSLPVGRALALLRGEV